MPVESWAEVAINEPLKPLKAEHGGVTPKRPACFF